MKMLINRTKLKVNAENYIFSVKIRYYMCTSKQTADRKWEGVPLNSSLGKISVLCK
jgi:hypothetical protein